jgi:hypothetical protein
MKILDGFSLIALYDRSPSNDILLSPSSLLSANSPANPIQQVAQSPRQLQPRCSLGSNFTAFQQPSTSSKPIPMSPSASVPTPSASAAASAIHALVVASVANSLAAASNGHSLTTSPAAAIDWSTLLSIQQQRQQQMEQIQQHASPNGSSSITSVTSPLSGLFQHQQGPATGTNNGPYSPYVSPSARPAGDAIANPPSHAPTPST